MLLAIYFLSTRGTWLLLYYTAHLLLFITWLYFFDIKIHTKYIYISKFIYLKIISLYLKYNGDEGYRSPCPSHAKRMLYHLSYIPLSVYISFYAFYPFRVPDLYFILFSKNASGVVRTHASLDSRSWDGPLRPLGHECFSILTFYSSSCALTLSLFLTKCIRWGSNPRISR